MSTRPVFSHGKFFLVPFLSLLLSGVVFAQAFTEFPNGVSPFGIASGPDGNLWFTESGLNSIGRMTTAGAFSSFLVPSASAFNFPRGITAGPDGNVWFTEQETNKIARITPAGVITEFSVPTSGSFPDDIVAGPDGNLWFTELHGNNIGRITPAGVFTEFPISSGGGPLAIAAGPDGNLWFTEINIGEIGRVTPAGVITEFPIPTPNSLPLGIAAGPDGNLWFTESSGSANRIGRITTGVVQTPTATAMPTSTPTMVPQGAPAIVPMVSFPMLALLGLALAGAAVFLMRRSWSIGQPARKSRLRRGERSNGRRWLESMVRPPRFERGTFHSGGSPDRRKRPPTSASAVNRWFTRAS
jgi:sugar lactone lactonase YvrE